MGAGAAIRLKKLAYWLVAGYLAIVAGDGVFVASQMERQHHEAVARATVRLEGLARALEEHVARSIGQADDLMMTVIGDLDRKIPFADVPERELYALFNTRIQRSPQIMSLGAFDRDGRPLAHSSLASARSRPAPRGETFDLLRRDPEASLAVGRVVQSPITGHYVFPLTRKVLGADGTIAGFITAAFNPRHFSEFYEELQLPPGGAVLIAHDVARRIIVRYPDTDAHFDRDFSKAPIFNDYAGRPQGTYSNLSLIDGAERLSSFRRVKAIPLIVVVSLPLEDVLAPLAAPRTQLVVATLVLALVLAVLFAFVYRHAKLTVKTEEALREANQALEERVTERTGELMLEVAERRRAATTLRKLSRAVEQSPHMIFVTDMDGFIDYVNPKFTEMTGYRADEAVGRQPSILKSGLTPLATYVDLWRTIKGGCEWHAELLDRRKDGTCFWASVSISPVRDENGRITHFVALHEDITARRLAEDMVRTAKDQAEIANRAKSDLLASMSHELRTPLNAVIGYSEALLANIFGELANPRQTEYLQDIHASGLYLLDLINDLLDLSAVEAGKLVLEDATFDLPETITACLRLIQPKAAAQQVDVAVALAPELSLITADNRRFKQIVLNLLSNAVKFTDPGGHVRLSAETVADGDLLLTVSDTGIGMDEKDISSAVTVFGRAVSPLARRREGTGLGLPLTVKLVAAHDGQLKIDSVKGKGTTVTVRLPGRRLGTTAVPA